MKIREEVREMYVRLFRRKASDTIFAQVCDGSDTRMVTCLQTADPGVAESRVCDVLRHHGRQPESVAVVWDLPATHEMAEPVKMVSA